MALNRVAQFEDEFRHICSTLRLKMKQLSNLSGERKKLAVREAEREMEEAEDVLRQLTNYARQNNVVGIQAKITSFSNDLSRIRRDFENTVRTGSSARDELLEGGTQQDDLGAKTLDQRAGLLQDRKMLQDGEERLKNTRAISARTEAIGTSILGNLDDQRQALNRANDRLGNTDQNLSRSRKILQAMDRRVMTNKLVLVLIIVALVALIGGIVYIKWFSGIWPSMNSTTTTTIAPTMAPTKPTLPVTTTTATTLTTTTKH